jgi:hypothetical protein
MMIYLADQNPSVTHVCAVGRVRSRPADHVLDGTHVTLVGGRLFLADHRRSDAQTRSVGQVHTRPADQSTTGTQFRCVGGMP